MKNNIKFTGLKLLSKQNSKNDGFTIVELMIALAVLSVILTISTVVMVQIGGLFDKGVTSSNLQNTTRNIAADVSSALEFSGSAPQQCTNTPVAGMTNCDIGGGYSYHYQNNNNQTVDYFAYCIGTARYSYVKNYELGTDVSNNDVTPYVLWRDTLTAASDPCIPANMNPSSGSTPTSSDPNSQTNSGYEMMSDHTRLTSFSISLVSGLGNGDVYSVNVGTAYGDSDLFDTTTGNCKSSLGSTSTQFCSTSSINTTVQGRLY